MASRETKPQTKPQTSAKEANFGQKEIQHRIRSNQQYIRPLIQTTNRNESEYGKATRRTTNISRRSHQIDYHPAGHALQEDSKRSHAIAALRTGHCDLRQYLHRFHLEDSPFCECDGESEETVEHY